MTFGLQDDTDSKNTRNFPKVSELRNMFLDVTVSVESYRSDDSEVAPNRAEKNRNNQNKNLPARKLLPHEKFMSRDEKPQEKELVNLNKRVNDQYEKKNLNSKITKPDLWRALGLMGHQIAKKGDSEQKATSRKQTARFFEPTKKRENLTKPSNFLKILAEYLSRMMHERQNKKNYQAKNKVKKEDKPNQQSRAKKTENRNIDLKSRESSDYLSVSPVGSNITPGRKRDLSKSRISNKSDIQKYPFSRRLTEKSGKKNKNDNFELVGSPSHSFINKKDTSQIGSELEDDNLNKSQRKKQGTEPTNKQKPAKKKSSLSRDKKAATAKKAIPSNKNATKLYNYDPDNKKSDVFSRAVHPKVKPTNSVKNNTNTGTNIQADQYKRPKDNSTGKTALRNSKRVESTQDDVNATSEVKPRVDAKLEENNQRVRRPQQLVRNDNNRYDEKKSDVLRDREYSGEDNDDDNGDNYVYPRQSQKTDRKGAKPGPEQVKKDEKNDSYEQNVKNTKPLHNSNSNNNGSVKNMSSNPSGSNGLPPNPAAKNRYESNKTPDKKGALSRQESSEPGEKRSNPQTRNDEQYRYNRQPNQDRQTNRQSSSSPVPSYAKSENKLDVMAVCSRISWDDYDELDPDDGDSRIVAEALNVRDVASQNRLLISHDIKPLAYARGRDLAVHQASDDWLRHAEPSPKDREIQRLKHQVAEFKKDEPNFEVSIKVSDIEPATIYKVAALDTVQTDALIATIKRRNPRRANGGGDPYGLFDKRDSAYDGNYSTYISKKLPTFASKFNEKLELLFNQRFLSIYVKNVGQIRADHLVVSVKTSDGWINRRVVFVPPYGPTAPVPKPDYLSRLHPQMNLMQNLIPPRIGRHEFETTLLARRIRETKASCEDFHSGQEYSFEGVIAPSSDAKALEITVTLTAKNLRGERTETFKLEKQIVPIAPCALVDLKTLEPKQDYPTKKEIERLLGARDFDEIDWDDQLDEQRYADLWLALLKSRRLTDCSILGIAKCLLRAQT